MVQKPELAFFVTLSVPFLCLVHDIYIFSEHYKVRRIGYFLRTEMGLANDDPIMKWENYVKRYREPFAVWGSLLFTVLLFAISAAIPKALQLQWTVFYDRIYTGWLIGTMFSITLVFLLYLVLNWKLK